MNRLTRIVSSLLLLVALCWVAGAEQADEIGAGLTEAIEPLFALKLAPGMAVSVVQGDELIYAAGFGLANLESGRPVTTDTLFYIASATKSFTAMTVAMLDQRGELSLDAPVTRYLPELKLQPPLVADEITVRDLLALTHGIDNDGPVVFRTAFSGEHDHDQLVTLLARHQPAEDGRAFAYGNLGYNIVGLAMDATLEDEWKQVLEREIFVPLGMDDTLGSLDDVDADRLAWPHAPIPDGFRRLPYTKAAANMHAAGGHVSTVVDLGRWIEANLNGGRVDGKQVLPASAVAEAQKQQSAQDRKVGSYHRYGWGLGWDLGTYDGDRLVHRFGSYAGFRSHMSFMPEQGVGVAVLVNDGLLGSFLADMVANAIYDTLLDKPDLEAHRASTLEKAQRGAAMGHARVREEWEKRSARQVSLPHPLAAYTGVFENEDYGRFEWRQEGERVVARIGLVYGEAEVYNAEENKLRVEITGRGEIVEFIFDGEQAASLIYNDQVFRRVVE